MSRLLLWLGVVLAAVGSGCRTIDPGFKGGTNPKFVYLIGETAAGDQRFPYEPGMTVMDLVVQRGGISTRGTAESIRVYRPSEDKTFSCKVNYDKVERGNVGQNIVLQGGDVVYVPKTITTFLYDGFKAVFPPWEDMTGKGVQFMEAYAADKAAK